MAPSFNSWCLLTQTAYRDLGPPLNQLIIMAVAEKIAAIRTADFFGDAVR